VERNDPEEEVAAGGSSIRGINIHICKLKGRNKHGKEVWL
jgi:hypothetical protein